MDKNENFQFISSGALIAVSVAFLIYVMLTAPHDTTQHPRSRDVNAGPRVRSTPEQGLEGGNIQHAIDTKQY